MWCLILGNELNRQRKIYALQHSAVGQARPQWSISDARPDPMACLEQTGQLTDAGN